MSYLKALVDTYDRHEKAVGKMELKEVSAEKSVEYTLLPISHTTQIAQIEVIISTEGEFFGAEVIDKVSTVIPFTEASGSRTSTNFVPHVLHDKLMYVAGDFTRYMQNERYLDKKRAAHLTYLKNLRDWCESEYMNERIGAIYTYLKKGVLIADLVAEQVLFLGQDNKLLKTWPDKSEKPKIFNVTSNDQESAFVRFNVVGFEPLEKVWKDKEIFSSYTNFYKTKLKEEDLCYVEGKRLPLTEKHPSKIRNASDMAKLISANDPSGFTYRGRFIESSEVANISYEASQKAHNALKWLIEKQGRAINERVFLVWGEKNVQIPDVAGSLEYIADTQEVFAEGYNESLTGRSLDIEGRENIRVLTIDSATTGRLSIVNYRVLGSQTYFERLSIWGKTCSWFTTRKVNGTMQEKILSPSLYEIAIAAYGPKPDKKIVKHTIERLLPCVLDQRRIPQDVLQSVVYRASTPTTFSDWEKVGKYSWEHTLYVACALIRKANKEGEYGVTLNKSNQSRSYLFGRLLAVADVLESGVLKKKEEHRLTNAMRLKRAFSSKPATTWAMIDSCLEPYISFLVSDSPGLHGYYQDILDGIFGNFKEGDFSSNTRLQSEFLLGFSHQRKELYTKKEEEKKEE